MGCRISERLIMLSLKIVRLGCPTTIINSLTKEVAVVITRLRRERERRRARI
jgi:hypothetical protein